MQPAFADWVAPEFPVSGRNCISLGLCRARCTVVNHTCSQVLGGGCLPVWLQVLRPVPSGAHSGELPAGEGTPCPVDEVSDPGPHSVCEV